MYLHSPVHRAGPFSTFIVRTGAQFTSSVYSKWPYHCTVQVQYTLSVHSRVHSARALHIISSPNAGQCTFSVNCRCTHHCIVHMHCFNLLAAVCGLNGTLLSPDIVAIRSCLTHECSMAALMFENSSRLRERFINFSKLKALLAHVVHAWGAPSLHQVS